MIDPNEIHAAIQAAHQIGATARAATAASFMAGVPAMAVDSASNVSSVIDTVHLTGQQMLGGLSQVKGSIDAQVLAHQEQQRTQSVYDYSPNMTDLRPTDATGFPRENATEFLATFKNMPKV